MVSGVGRGMGVLDGGDDRRREWAVLEVNLGRPIVTNGDFATQLFLNYFGISCFYRAMHYSAKRGLIAIACRLSVCLSVCLLKILETNCTNN